MMLRIWIAYKVEMMKALRQRFTYVGMALVLMTVALAPLLRGLEIDGESDYEYLGFAAPTALNIIGLLVILIYGGGLISTEMASGTIRLVLVRPLLRHEWLLAKVLLAMTYVVALAAGVSVAAWATVLFFGDAVGVASGGEMAFTAGEVFIAYTVGCVVVLLPLWTAAAYAVMIGTLVRNVAAAVTLAVGCWFLLDMFKYPLGIAPYVFTSYLDTPWQPFRDLVSTATPPDWFALMPCVAISLLYGLGFVAVAILVFHRRNIQP